jgi:hypothetical protein
MARWSARSAQTGSLFAAAILCATAATAAAEVRVTNTGDDRLTIQARDATVQEILDALSQSHTIRFQASEALSRHVTGTYSGTLPRVLSRIFEGYDHVIRSTRSGFQVDIVSAAQATKFTASIVSSATVAASAGTPRGVSSNVDLDEESARPKSASAPQSYNLAAGAHTGAPRSRPARSAALAVNSGAPRVSGNVDLDEESR